MRRLSTLALFASIALLGCDPPVGNDAGPLDAPAPPDGSVLFDGTVELGEGNASFRPIASGDTLLIARGCQGSQHVWIGLRSRALDPRGMTVRLELVRPGTDERVSLEFYVRLSFTAMGEYAELTSLTLQLPTPDLVIGEDLILRAEIVDRTGHGARSEVPVQVAWGTEVCGG